MFGLSKRAITILFGLLALAFALGAILLFTPQAAQQTRGKPVLWVNGKALYELDLLRLQGNDPLYAASPEGLLKTLVDTYFLEQVILTEALKQDAARVRVSSATCSLRERTAAAPLVWSPMYTGGVLPPCAERTAWVIPPSVSK